MAQLCVREDEIPVIIAMEVRNDVVEADILVRQPAGTPAGGLFRIDRLNQALGLTDRRGDLVTRRENIFGNRRSPA